MTPISDLITHGSTPENNSKLHCFAGMQGNNKLFMARTIRNLLTSQAVADLGQLYSQTNAKHC